jgi:hypothetical protein
MSQFRALCNKAVVTELMNSDGSIDAYLQHLER